MFFILSLCFLMKTGVNFLAKRRNKINALHLSVYLFLPVEQQEENLAYKITNVVQNEKILQQPSTRSKKKLFVSWSTSIKLIALINHNQNQLKSSLSSNTLNDRLLKNLINMNSHFCLLQFSSLRFQINWYLSFFI